LRFESQFGRIRLRPSFRDAPFGADPESRDDQREIPGSRWRALRNDDL
jgi:hypothetical protein